jgi:hypothetical protein
MPLIKKIFIVRPLKFIILFTIFVHTIITSHNIIICNYNS